MRLSQLVLALFCGTAVLCSGTGLCAPNMGDGKPALNHLRLPAVRALAGNALWKKERAGAPAAEAKAVADCVFQVEQRVDCQPEREKSQGVHTVQYATLHSALILWS